MLASIMYFLTKMFVYGVYGVLKTTYTLLRIYLNFLFVK